MQEVLVVGAIAIPVDERDRDAWTAAHAATRLPIAPLLQRLAPQREPERSAFKERLRRDIDRALVKFVIREMLIMALQDMRRTGRTLPAVERHRDAAVIAPGA